MSSRLDSNWIIVFVCWLIAGISTLTSLFFSEIMHFAPCVLCWYQRIFMFPLVIIFLTGVLSFDKSIVKYALPLTSAGAVVAFYHNLLYYGFIPESIQPCSKGVSCAEVHINLLGFITIPLLSLIAFLSLVSLLIILRRNLSR